MNRLLLRIITAVQLTRLTMAFGAVADIWFVILLTRAMRPDHASLSLPAALLAGAVTAVGLFAYGAALNDVLDARHDSAFSPQRPIPAGRIKVGQAIVVTVGALIVAVLAGGAFGLEALRITLLVAAIVLFYNAAGKYVPGVGIVTIGLVHAAHMFIPAFDLTFTLPVWLVMTHVSLIAAAVYHLEDKRPRLSTRGTVGAVTGWVFWSAVVLGLGFVQGGVWPERLTPLGIAWPVLAILGFLAVARWKTAHVGGRAAAEKLKRYGAMWQSLYGAAWMLALGLETEAIGLGLFAVAGFAAMTLIKEVTGLSGQPVAYR